MSGNLGVFSRKSLMLLVALGGCLALLAVAAGAVRAEQMMATWYGPGFEGATTASGEPFDPNDYTAAHKTLPFGTKLIVTYNSKSVVVRINDRGPYSAGYDLDLSQAAAEYIGLIAAGSGAVSVETADPSTPTGPYTGEAQAPSQQQEQQSAQRPEAERQTSRARQPQPQEVREPAADVRTGSVGEADAAVPAAQDQYAGEQQARSAGPQERQSASAEQYRDSQASRPQAADRKPQAPQPEQAETAPAEPAESGATDRSPVELIELAEAKPVEDAEQRQPAVRSAEQAPEPARSGHGEGLPGITVLPDTGGVPLGALLIAGLFLGSGALVVRRTLD